MNNFDARMVFDNAKAALIKAFGTPDIVNVAKLTQGSLRFEQPLVAGQTIINFPVLDNQAIYAVTEDRLNLQDAFVISSIKMGLAAPEDSDRDNTNNFAIDCYPNQVKYGTANALALNSLYNANLQIAVNNDIILPKWDLWRHYNAPETQQTAALGAGSPMDQDRGSFDGFYPVEPNIVLIGQKKIALQIIFKGDGLASVLANSRCVIQVRGVLAQNVTIIS